MADKNKSSYFINYMSGVCGTLTAVIICTAALIISFYAIFTAVITVGNINRRANEIKSDIAAAAAFSDKSNEQGQSKFPENIQTDSSDNTDFSEISTEETEIRETENETTLSPETDEPETEAETAPEENRYIIFIDPGHGFDDPGTDSVYLGEWSEMHINLDVALKVGEFLEKAASRSDLPIEIHYTRTENTKNDSEYFLMNPYDREDIIESVKNVNAVVSIHCDSYEQDTSIDGTRIFYCLDASPLSYALATKTASYIEKYTGLSASGKSPNVQWQYRDTAFYMTKCTDYPSILIEMGFVTNENDAKNMMDEEWRSNMAQGIAEGILAFLGID